MGKAKIVSPVFELMYLLRLSSSENNQALHRCSEFNHTKNQKRNPVEYTGNQKVGFDFYDTGRN